MMADKEEKPLVWIGSSKKDLMALSTNVRRFLGHALDFAQRGDRRETAKVLKGFGGAGVLRKLPPLVDKQEVELSGR